MAYTALKPCKFAGQRFNVGDSVPAELVQPGAAKNLIKMGRLAMTNDTTQSTEPKEIIIESPSIISLAIHAEEGDLPLDLTPEGLQAAVDAMTSTVNDAEPIIKEMTDEDALIFLDACDQRKSIGELAKERAQELNAPQEGTESEGDQ